MDIPPFKIACASILVIKRNECKSTDADGGICPYAH